jgi:putative spermidine/putrescine transport system ATP-binding protein
VYVTHDQEEALSMSDRIAILNNGQIEQVGDPISLYERPLTDFVAGFVGVSNLIERDGRHVTIRPEKIQLLAGDASASPELHVESGVIRDVVYVGVLTRYVIDLDAGGELVVVRQNDEEPTRALASRGSRTRIAWRPDQVYAIHQQVGSPASHDER